MASEATAPLPAQRPLTIREEIAANTALLEVLADRIAQHTRALNATRQAGQCLSPADYWNGLNRIRDVQFELMGSNQRIERAGMVATLQEMHAARQAEAAPAAEAVRRVRRAKKGQHAAERSLRALPGFALPAAAAFRGLHPKFPPLHSVFGHKALLTAGAGSAVALVAVAGLQHSHTLPYVTGTGQWHAPAAIAYGATPVIGPTYTRPLPTAYVTPEQRHKTASVAAPDPLPVVTVIPDPVPDPTTTDGSWSSQPSDSPQTSDSSQPSGSSQPSQSSGWSRQSSQPQGQSQLQGQWQARGQHAGPDSDEGNSGYQGRHDGGSSDGGWQQGQRQNAPQQRGGWQQGGGQQGGHGQQGNHRGH